MRKPAILLAAIALIGVTVRLTPAEAQSLPLPLGPPCPSKIMAFYYVWYGGPPDWRHWANPAPFFHDPNSFTSCPQCPGGIERDIAATDYPELGPYNSQDPAVIDQHLAWAASSGIDVLISSWWGPLTYEDQSLALLLAQIIAQKSPVRASAYLETWALFYGAQFQPSFFTDPRNFELDSRSQIRQNAINWICYLLTNYGDSPAFFHTTKNGSDVPVLFMYSASLFTPPEWQQIFAGVQQQCSKDAFYQGDVEGVDFTANGSVFDGIHLYTPVPLTAEGDLSLAARVVNPQAAVTNPASPVTDQITVGADYQAWATEARALGKSWAATVIPGFDDRKIRNPSFVVSRQHGVERTYNFFWREALLSRPDWVLITSFNEWHEGSEIEPSVQYGNEFLTWTQGWAGQIHACTQPPLISPPLLP